VQPTLSLNAPDDTNETLVEVCCVGVTAVVVVQLFQIGFS